MTTRDTRYQQIRPNLIKPADSRSLAIRNLNQKKRPSSTLNSAHTKSRAPDLTIISTVTMFFPVASSVASPLFKAKRVRFIMMPLFLLLAFIAESPATAQEVVAMTVLAECDRCGIEVQTDDQLGDGRGSSTDGFYFIEVTACSGIADLTRYSFVLYDPTTSTPTTIYTFAPTTGQQVTNIPAGTRIYVIGNGATFDDMENFFGSSINVNNLFVASKLFLTGNENFSLNYNDAVVDAYNGGDDSTHFENGWVTRLPGTAASSTFISADWDLSNSADSAFGYSLPSQVSTNAALSDPIQLGAYPCPITPQTTPPPTPSPVVILPAQEVVAMTVLAECDRCGIEVQMQNQQGQGSRIEGFYFIEVTACSGIADLTRYSFVQYDPTTSTPTTIYTFAPTTGQQVTNIPAGTRIYVIGNGATFDDIENFFGSSINGNNLFVASKLFLSGKENFSLNYNDAVADAYNGGDDSTHFENGWVTRLPGTAASATFISADWDLSNSADSAFGYSLPTQVSTNAALSDPIQLGAYPCPITPQPTPPPTPSPTLTPTKSPTATPTKAPTPPPTVPPTKLPTTSPTAMPTTLPSAAPTEKPTTSPTATPTTLPTKIPTTLPTATPTNIPTTSPTSKPTNIPTSSPTAKPTNFPTTPPTVKPTKIRTTPPTVKPTNIPTKSPTAKPTSIPSKLPTAKPTNKPTSKPTLRPTSKPSSCA